MDVSHSHVVDQAARHATHGLRGHTQDAQAEGRQQAFPSHLLWPLALGLVGSIVLSALYLGLVTLAESWAHATSLLREDAAFVVPLILGFGMQIGLFTYLKRGVGAASRAGAAGAVTGTSGGTSALGMLACCAHHVTDVLPLVGLSGAAIFLAQFKIPFMIAGLVSNAAGITMLVVTIRKAKRLSSDRMASSDGLASSEGACH